MHPRTVESTDDPSFSAKQELGSMSAILWGIWNSSSVTPQQCVHASLTFLKDWLQANETSPITPVEGNAPPYNKWRKPPPGKLKCNVDATVDSAQHVSRLGMILRDDCGEVIDCLAKNTCFRFSQGGSSFGTEGSSILVEP